MFLFGVRILASAAPGNRLVCMQSSALFIGDGKLVIKAGTGSAEGGRIRQ